MKIGTVTGSVWATRKANCLMGQTFLLIDTGTAQLVAADQVGAGVGDHVLLAKSDMVSLVDSLVAPLSLVNALIVAIAAKREKELSQTFANLERIWDEYDVYEKQVEK